MAITKFSQNNFLGGIQNYDKLSTIQNGYYFGYCINYRDNPQAVTLYPGTVKESGSVVTDLIKWGDLLPTQTTAWFYGNTGNIYQRSSSAVWTNLHTAASSHGNGLSYFFADDYLYYTTDSTIGRYGPTQGSSPTSVDDFLGAQGGVPTNTASLVLASASSMYADAADSASLSITGDLTLETFFKATTLPTTGNSMTLIGKWDESGATRSYIMDLFGVSGFFGAGTDGSLTISTNTTDAPIDSACSGTSGTQTLTATNASFAANQIILIIQMQGTNAGQWERNTIQSYTAGTITTTTPLKTTYSSSGSNTAQVIVVKQYTNVTVNNGITWQPKTWNGTVGGILVFLANGTVTNNGTILADGLGFRGANLTYAGEGNNSGTTTFLSNTGGNGGGGGLGSLANQNSSGGAGGGNGTAGTNGQPGNFSGSVTTGGIAFGSADLTTMSFGGAGGASGYSSGGLGTGGNGGGIIFISAVTFTNSGSITSLGQVGANANVNHNHEGGGGGGAGGSILIKAQTATLGTITATGGAGGTGANGGGNGGAGGDGRLALDYLTSFTAGTENPAINTVQDSTLVTTTTIQARLGISNDGTASEYLTQNLSTLTTGKWNRLSITWKASTSTANFYLNAVLIGTSVGTKTAISDNISLLYVGADKGASVVKNFFNGKLNDMRIWNNVQTADQIAANNLIQVAAGSVGLQAYYKFNSAYTDATANANTLTAVNSPTFDTADVPFPNATTRLDIDTSQVLTGQTYAVPTAISEASTDLLSFTPVNDPQKSISFNVSAKGTGDWTVTIHDQQNNVIASKTITNANMMSSGFQEFVFATPWRIVVGKTYHAHVTVSTGTSTLVCGTSNNLTTADYVSYFGFLVSDTSYHPIYPFLQYEMIGNERYIATWDGAFYHPNAIAFPTGWRVRALSTWREYLAIGVWRGNNITSATHGRVYFWDGIAPTFNFYIDIPDGQINALWGKDSDLFIIAGYRGDLLDFQGNYFFDSGNSSSIKLRFIPKRAAGDTVEVFPGALNYYRNLLHIGYMSSGTSSTITRGVYAYGTFDPELPQTLSCDYLLSTGNSGSTVSIGCVFPIGNKLIIGWQDGIAFGADVVDFANNPAPHGRIELMIQDDGVIWHPKANTQIRADFEAIRSGESIDVAMSVERGSYLKSTADTTVGDTFLSVPTQTLGLTTGRGREFQFAVDMYATGTTSPTLLGLSVLHDDMKEEDQF